MGPSVPSARGGGGGNDVMSYCSHFVGGWRPGGLCSTTLWLSPMPGKQEQGIIAYYRETRFFHTNCADRLLHLLRRKTGCYPEVSRNKG